MVNVLFNVRFYAVSYGMFPTVDSCRCDSISGVRLCFAVIFRRFSNFHNARVAPFSAAIAPCIFKAAGVF